MPVLPLSLCYKAAAVVTGNLIPHMRVCERVRVRVLGFSGNLSRQTSLLWPFHYTHIAY